MTNNDGDAHSHPTDAAFLATFEAGRWPLENWHHRDHVKLAYLYLVQHPFAEALARVRESIRRHNAAHHVPEGLTSGYHETMTAAWLRLVDAALAETGPAPTADAFCDAHPELLDRRAMRAFYSRERFLSAEAKVSFLEPDVRPLPQVDDVGSRQTRRMT